MDGVLTKGSDGSRYELITHSGTVHKQTKTCFQTVPGHKTCSNNWSKLLIFCLIKRKAHDKKRNKTQPNVRQMRTQQIPLYALSYNCVQKFFCSIKSQSKRNRAWFWIMNNTTVAKLKKCVHWFKHML